jgi:uncharacterized membrane protein
MKERTIAAGAGTLLLFLILGGVWIGIGYIVPSGAPRSAVMVVLAFAFLATYIWLLTSRIRAILTGDEPVLRNGLVAALEVFAMLLSFALVYQQIGIIDNTVSDSPVVHELGTSLYYSVVTFTTLGYGDFYPQGVGRALAGMQALTGYLVLGLLATVVAKVVSPHHPAGGDGDSD